MTPAAHERSAGFRSSAPTSTSEPRGSFTTAERNGSYSRRKRSSRSGVLPAPRSGPPPMTTRVGSPPVWESITWMRWISGIGPLLRPRCPAPGTPWVRRSTRTNPLKRAGAAGAGRVRQEPTFRWGLSAVDRGGSAPGSNGGAVRPRVSRPLNDAKHGLSLPAFERQARSAHHLGAEAAYGHRQLDVLH